MKLLYNNTILGVVSDIHHEGYWYYGIFEKNDNFDAFTSFFEDLTSEECIKENIYDQGYYNDDNWYILMQDTMQGICLPAIYSDGEIAFRFR